MPSTFTETFDSEAGAPGLGSFSIEFRPGTQHILGPHVTRTSEVAGGPTDNWRKDTLVVTSTDLGPSASKSDVLSAAIFSGRILTFDVPIDGDGAWSIGGPSILALWGGSEPKYGPQAGASVDDDTLTLALLLLVSASNHRGLSYTVDASVSTNALGVVWETNETVRDLVNKAIRNTTTATEYRCTPQGQVIFAARGDDAAYRQTPQVMFTSAPTTMRDGDLWAFKVTGRVSYDYGVEAALCYVADSTHSYVSNAAWAGRISYDFGGTTQGNDGVYFGDTPENNNLDADDQLASVYCRKERMTLSVDAHSLKEHHNAGDYAWVHAPAAFLEDASENINFAGEETHPIKLRSAEMTCPVRKTHGVYIVHTATQYGGANSVERLNDYVEFATDTDPATVKFDPAPPMRKTIRGRRWRRSFSDDS